MPTSLAILQKKVVSVGEHCVMAPVCAMSPELARMELELVLLGGGRAPRAPLNPLNRSLFMLF
jgi:hypothetical protein